MASCVGTVPAGLQKNCGSNFEKVKNVYLLEAGTIFASKLEAASLVKWRQLIQVTSKVWGGRVVNSYEVTTSDPAEISLDSGKKLQSDKPIPSASFMLNTNVCDSNMLFNVVDGKSYDVVYELLNGNIVVQRFRGGTRGGLNAKCYLKTKGIPQPSDVGNNVKLDIYFESYDSFLNLDYIELVGWNLSDEILLSSPIGLIITEESAYTTASGDVDVQVNVRCADALTGLVVGDFVIIGSNDLDTPAITAAVDNGNGSYTLTLEKAAVPVSLSVGDYMTIQVQKKTGAVIDYISNKITIIALV